MGTSFWKRLEHDLQKTSPPTFDHDFTAYYPKPGRKFQETSRFNRKRVPQESVAF
jgi:hypothetical protein